METRARGVRACVRSRSARPATLIVFCLLNVRAAARVGPRVSRTETHPLTLFPCLPGRFPATKRFTATVQLLNAAEPAHLTKVLGRLLKGLPDKVC